MSDEAAADATPPAPAVPEVAPDPDVFHVEPPPVELPASMAGFVRDETPVGFARNDLTLARNRLAKAEADGRAAIEAAVARAGDDRIARATAKAKAEVDMERALASAEGDVRLASDRLDSLLLQAAADAKAEAFRVAEASARAAKYEADVAAADPLRTGNPFADPIRPTITRSQFDAITDPVRRERAAREAIIVDDPAPPGLTAKEARDVVADGRRVMNRAAFDRLSPVDQGRAAMSGAVIVD